MSNKNPGQPTVFIPENAQINMKPEPMQPPKVKYDKSKQNIDIDAVKKIVKGEYGKD